MFCAEATETWRSSESPPKRTMLVMSCAGATSIPRAALGAELRRSLRLLSAAAALLLRRQRRAALLAELAALRLRAALRADRAGDLADVARRRPVDRARLLLNLLARRFRLRGGHLLVEVGRAVLAQPRLLVPADRLAHPVAAARALLEDRRDLVDCFLQRAVVRAAADRALHLVRAVRHAPENAAEQIARRARRRAEHAHR